MFNEEIYIQRRKQLKEQLKSGVVLFLGNEESPMNYPDNTYHFRQDSSFLYYWGLDEPGLAAVIDIDEDTEKVYGYDFTVDDIVWMGPQATIAQKAQQIGAGGSGSLEDLDSKMKDVVGKKGIVHYLPQYRADNLLKIERLAGIHNSKVNEKASVDFIKAVVAQRSIKSADEVEQIEDALKISYEMNRIAMRISKPGIYESEVYGVVEGVVLSVGSNVSFPIILEQRFTIS